jgi:hypothetical protein
MTPIIIDDFVPPIFQNAFEVLFMSEFFGWAFHLHSTYNGEKFEIANVSFPVKDHIQMTHRFYDDNEESSTHAKYLKPLFSEFERKTGYKILSKIRVKSNLVINQGAPYIQPPHVDGAGKDDKGMPSCVGKLSLLYYVNESDGDTILYDKHYYGEPLGEVKEIMRVSPKKGRAVIFDSNQVHSASAPASSDYRMVINSILEIE